MNYWHSINLQYYCYCSTPNMKYNDTEGPDEMLFIINTDEKTDF